MKTFRFIGMALFAILMCVNFASCSSSDDDPTEEKEDEKVDFTGYTSTDLKINGKTFWLDDDYCGVDISDYGDDGQYIHFLLEGKTVEMDLVSISLTESLPLNDFKNINKNITSYITLNCIIKENQQFIYDYVKGKISAKVVNGTLKVNFDNAVFEDAAWMNSEIEDKRTFNGEISYRF